jgi:hypothetical protein
MSLSLFWMSPGIEICTEESAFAKIIAIYAIANGAGIDGLAIIGCHARDFDKFAS